MLKQPNFLHKNGFYIWFDKKHKKEYYITQLPMCKIKFVKDIDNKYNSIKLINGYSNHFDKEEDIYYVSADLMNPFEENYGMFLINFLNADFSTFESAYLTFFCFYGMKLLEEFTDNVPNIRTFRSELDFKTTYESIFYECNKKLKKFQNLIQKCVDYSYNLKENNKYLNSTSNTKFISYSINKNLFIYMQNINMHFNINYAYNAKDISSKEISPLSVKEKIDNKVIGLYESPIYNSKYLSSLIYLSLYEIATNTAVSVGICKNCNKYFISYCKSAGTYCRITYAENDEICKDTGVQIAYKKKQAENACLKLYRQTYQKKLMFAKRSGDENVKRKFTEWKLLAREKVKNFENKTISENELIEWLNKN